MAAALVMRAKPVHVPAQPRVYSEIVGGISNTEAQGLFSLDTQGYQLADLIQRTLEGVQLTPQDIGLIVAHGNGNVKSDISESQAIKNIFSSSPLPVTAFKWSMGHTLVLRV